MIHFFLGGGEGGGGWLSIGVFVLLENVRFMAFRAQFNFWEGCGCQFVEDLLFPVVQATPY